MSQQAFKFETAVGPEGKVEVCLPLAPGTRVEILVLTPESDQFDDLEHAAVSSMDFWDNPWDDEDWNNA